MSDLGEAVPNPTGDPLKQGYIYEDNVVPIQSGLNGSFFGPIQLQSPGRVDPDSRDVPGALLEARRKTDLLIAHSMDDAIAAFYGSSREVEELIEAVRDYDH